MARAIDADALLDEFKKEIAILKETPGKDDYDKGIIQGYKEAITHLKVSPTLTPPNEPLLCEFDVVDTKTGKYPDWERIAREESWAKGLVYCDMDGIAIREDGSLILLDECGNCVSCPPDRFEIRRPPEGEDA